MLYLRLLLTTLLASIRARRDLVLENLALRHQLAVYARQRSKPSIARGDRRFWALLSRTWPGWRHALVVVRPETVVRWHRSAWRAHWRRKSRRRGPGRPRISRELQQLIVQLARENPRWGAVRIVGELRALGFEVSARTVRRYRQHALRRPPSQSWRTFLCNHISEIWAADLFTVQTLKFRTLYVFVVIDYERRRIRHWNLTEHPKSSWIWQQLVEATPWGEQPRFLIRDRDRSYGGAFVAHARRIGIETVLTPFRAPNANAIAKRVIGTLRRECLDHVIPLGERHLRRVLAEYIEHYNAVRPHRSLALDSPMGRPPRQRERGDRLISRSSLEAYITSIGGPHEVLPPHGAWTSRCRVTR